MASSLAFGGRGRPTIAGYGQIVHIVAHSSSAQIVQCLLEVLHVPPRFHDLALCSGRNLGIVCSLPHLIRCIDNVSFSLDFALDILDRLVFVHLDGIARPQGPAVERTESVVKPLGGDQLRQQYGLGLLARARCRREVGTRNGRGVAKPYQVTCGDCQIRRQWPLCSEGVFAERQMGVSRKAKIPEESSNKQTLITSPE